MTKREKVLGVVAMLIIAAIFGVWFSGQAKADDAGHWVKVDNLSELAPARTKIHVLRDTRSGCEYLVATMTHGSSNSTDIEFVRGSCAD